MNKANRAEQTPRAVKVKNTRARDSTLRVLNTARDLQRTFDETRAQFILSELDLAITFCRIALSTQDPERARRNCGNAAKASEAAAHYLERARMTATERQRIAEKFIALRPLLAKTRQLLTKSQSTTLTGDL